ncbi:ImmA/IrrE family metallo-endopeptidase [Hymenobacter gummosus]|uniref:ImmA/IrrE family metallo-endopeptidase n=1 Tax=Hymenobacter gummosus TaxID=1776032 RepID=A0A431U5J0_9BACT|nr:ImmA/IrrE family metallo-endopeptidase [Hymenobacter gummosus]RTQ51635.1 ImmA/IrrE family metallo-endopeptidase [Hymenobacter gummosus]
MNTVLKGDTFEDNSYDLIKKSIENDDFGISPKYAKVFQKKGYYSDIRKKDIIFDLSIEVWPPNATRYAILYLIECKDYSKKRVPVGDVENFLYKIREINNSHGNDAKGAKGVFISNNSFQEGGLEIAKETGLMLIEVNSENELMIKLHKADRVENDEVSKQEKEIEAFLFKVFDLTKVQGLKKYSKKDIENVVINLLNLVDKSVLKGALSTPLDRVVEFLKKEYEVKFDFDNYIQRSANRSVLGYYDVTERIITIDRSVVGTERFYFLLAHEIGHLVLHSELKINQQVYESFQDSEYDFMSDKYVLNNYKNWIEWQANEFASNLVMPSVSFYNRLVHVQRYLGISRAGHIYLDDQPINRKDFGDITTYLSKFFKTTYTSVIYRLETLELITYNRKKDEYRENFRNFYRDFEDGF